MRGAKKKKKICNLKTLKPKHLNMSYTSSKNINSITLKPKSL